MRLLLPILALLAIPCSAKLGNHVVAPRQVQSQLVEPKIVGANLAINADFKSVLTSDWGLLFALTAAFNVFSVKAHNHIGSSWGFSSVQLLLSSVFVFATKIRKLPNLNKDEIIKLLPSSALLALGFAWGIHALFSGAGFFNTFKALTPFVSIVLGYAFSRNLPKLYSALALIPIFGGVVYSINGNLDTGAIESLFKSQHAKYALGSIVALALRAYVDKQGKVAMEPAKLQAYSSLVAAALLVPVAIHYEGKNVHRSILDAALNNIEGLALFIGSAVVLALLSDASAKVAATAPEPAALGNALNRVAALAAVKFLLKEDFSDKRLIGIAVAVVGGVLYDVYDSRKI